jgi:peptide subunit release factor 1 (eRF1)
MRRLARSHVSRRALLSCLPDAATAGRSIYRPPGTPLTPDHLGTDADAADELREIAADSETGCVLITTDDGTVLVVPPFAVESAAAYDVVELAPLVDLLDRPRAIAVMLLRLGGFSVGFFRGATLVDSKTDQRFVKNRHRKGGQSQRRFDRIREKQVHELFSKACETARERLQPYETEVQHVLFGGDRLTLLAFRKECAYFERYGDRVMRRLLPVAGDPRKASLEAAPREIWSSDVYEVAPPSNG